MAKKKYIYVCKECLGKRCTKHFKCGQIRGNIKCDEDKPNYFWTLIAVVKEQT